MKAAAIRGKLSVMRRIEKVEKPAKRKFLSMMWYQLSTNFMQVYISLGVMVLYALFTIIFSKTVDDKIKIGSPDMMLIMWAMILGIVFFGVAFNFGLSNGLSRKSFFFSTVSAMAVTAFIWSLLGATLTYCFNLITPQNVLFNLIYPESFFGLWMWMLTGMLGFTAIGWFARVVLYRTSKRAKLLILLGIALFSLVFLTLALTTNGAFLRGLGKFFSAVMGFTLATPNPYIASLFFLALFVLFTLFVWLMIRKAEFTGK